MLLLCLWVVPTLQVSKLVLLIFFGWSICECVRYTYYTFNVLGVHIKYLHWLRYTLPLASFPFVSASEAFLEYCILTEPKLHTFDINLPNTFNFGFDMQQFLLFWLALHVLLSPLMFQLMLKQRTKQMIIASNKLKGDDEDILDEFVSKHSKQK